MNIYSDAIEQLGIFTIVGGILAIVATVLAYVFIVPEKRREKLNAFGKFLHDTCNFKYLIVEKILQALYIFFTADMIILGFFMRSLPRLKTTLAIATGWASTAS